MKTIINKKQFAAILLSMFIAAQVYTQPSPPAGKKWETVPTLTDEFTTWNDSKWYKELWNYPEPVSMQAANSGVTNGKLWIKATYNTSADTTKGRWFETSRVHSKNQISYPMYTECKMKTAHISAFNTFWLNNGGGENRDEIDICENVSNPSKTSMADWAYKLHSQCFIVENKVEERKQGNFDNRNLSDQNSMKGKNWNEEYHTLGLWWKDANNVQFYINGEEAGSVTTVKPFTRDLNIIWDLWTSPDSWFCGLPIKTDLSDDNVNTMYVDWIHTYKLVDNVNKSPVANAGEDQILSTGTTTTNLSGSATDPDGNSITYSWSQVGGPDVTISNSSSAETTVSGLTDNNEYTFRLTANDGIDNGTDDIKIIVKGSAENTIEIEAEDFDRTGGSYGLDGCGADGFGTETEGVNCVNNSEYAEYDIDVTTAGSYKITYMISTTLSDREIKFIKNGTLISTDAVNNNGAWNNYEFLAASEEVELTAGMNTIRLEPGDTEWNWNLDKIILTKQEINSAKDADSKRIKLDLYPNPANNEITISGLPDKSSKLFIYDLPGNLVLSAEALPEVSKINISNLETGLYILKMSNDEHSSSIRFSKN